MSTQTSCLGPGSEVAPTDFPAWMTDDLSASGLNAERAGALGFRPVTHCEMAELLGFAPSESVDGYRIPFLDPEAGAALLTPDGRPFVRVKLERTITMGADGATAKYLSPRGGGQHAFVLPEVHQAALDTKRLLLTEGEKKAVAATDAGFHCVGLCGPFGWLEAGSKTLLPELEPYATRGAVWTLVWDSDARWNFDFALATARLEEQLRCRSCTLQVIVLPERWPEAEADATIQKTGLDDFLLQQGVEQFQRLLDGAPVSATRSDDIFAGWITNLCHGAIPDHIVPELADQLVRKGLYDGVPADLRRNVMGVIRLTHPRLAEHIECAIHHRLEREFDNVRVGDDGGRAVVNGCFVQAPAPLDEEPWRVVSLKGELVYCCREGSHASRPFLKRHLVRVERPRASAENGKLGGRPAEGTPADAANAYLARVRHGFGDLVPIRFYRGEWYKFNGQYYIGIWDDDLRSDLAKFLRNHPAYKDRISTKYVTDVIQVLKAFDACAIPSTVATPCSINGDEFSPAPGWIATQTHLVNIVNLAKMLSGEEVDEADVRRNLSPQMFVVWGLPFRFDPEAKSPLFDKALREILPAEDARQALQMMAGLCLIPETKYNVFFVLFGPPGSGKSTVVEIISALIGSANICGLQVSKFLDKHSAGALTQKLVNILGDSDTDSDGISCDRIEGMIKNITDGGLIHVDNKYKNPFDAPAIARIVQAANNLPNINDRTGAMWDRLRVIHFECRFRGTEVEDPDLRKKIIAQELPGVFLWAVKGLADLLKLQRFPESAGGLEAKRRHREASDHEAAFLTETCVADPEDRILTKDLYSDYRSWMQQNGYKAFGSAKFKQHVKRVFLSAVEARQRDAEGRHVRIWQGIKKQGGGP